MPEELNVDQLVSPASSFIRPNTSTVVHKIVFETDKDANLIVTRNIILSELQKAYHDKLWPEDRSSDFEKVKEVMRTLDTEFHNISQNPKYMFATFAHELFLNVTSNVVFTAEEVNYMAVGAGFRHFDIFMNSSKVMHKLVELWNQTEHGHPASGGEHYWGVIGFQTYPEIANVCLDVP